MSTLAGISLEQDGAFATTILDALREALVILDADQRVVCCNACFYRTFQVDPRETTGRRLYDLGNGQWDIPALRDLLRRALHNETEVRDFPVSHNFPALGRRRMVLNVRRISHGARRESLLLAIEDRTEHRRMEKQLARHTRELERSNQELERFAYVASHDLQEPLRIISNFTQLLARRYRGRLDADADDFVGFIVDAATRMQSLINSLLAYSRLTTRGSPFVSTDCRAVLDVALENLRPSIEEAHAQITCDPLPTVEADPAQLGQVFQNIIGNAIKFRGNEPPRVHVAARQEDGCWLFTVRDNGIGFDPKYADQIFVLFRRLHGPGQYGGTGVGLAICKRIIERHGGRIWVQAKPDEGTTFSFTLPHQHATPEEEEL